MKQELTPQEAYTRLTTYCARSEHSPEDIRRKLHSWGIPMEETPAIIERLEQEGFLSPERSEENTYGHEGPTYLDEVVADVHLVIVDG